MAAVAAPPPASLAGSSVPRPTSAASNSNSNANGKRSTSVTSKRGSEPPAPAAAAPKETKIGQNGADNEVAIKVEEVKEDEGEGKNSRSGSPSNPTRPPIRPIPAVRSKFDLEPNPFEQSFRESHHSDSQEDIRESGNTPPRGGDATAIKHNALPPLSSLTSPAAADPSQFPWLANQSLRTGPLSPAMLGGPKGATNAEDNGGFDSSAFRTGFTPGTGSGFTPSFTSLMGGAGFSNLPLPSPNTAAFLNMVTNATPIEGDPSANSNLDQNGNRGNGQQQGPSAIPPHMQNHGLSHIANHPDMPQDTITPNTLSALTGVMNDMNRQSSMHQQQQPPPPHYYNPHMQQQQQQPGGPPNPGQQQGQGQYLPPGLPHVDYAQQSANAASQAANGLFLLSQAHQELSKREEEGRGPAPGPVGQQGPHPGMGGMGGMAPGAAHAHGHAQGPMMYPGPGQPGPHMGGPPPLMGMQHMQSQQGQGQGSIQLGAIQPNSLGGAGKRNSGSGSNKGNGAGGGPATLNSIANNSNTNGTKRKSDASDLPKGGKKGKKGTSPHDAPGGKKIKGESTSPMGNLTGMGSFNGMSGMGGMGDDDDDMDSDAGDGISKITGKPETEEEKRKNFLERNRQAALKCRQRKKQWLNELQTKVEQLQMENDRLNQTVAGLHDEIGRLSGVLMQHRDCGLGLPAAYGRPLR